MTAVEGKPGKLIHQSHALLRAAMAGDLLATAALLDRLQRDELVHEALRSWLLVCAELGAARLPGGELAEPPEAFLRVYTTSDRPWAALLRQTMTHALNRDGEALFVDLVNCAHDPDVLSYVAATVKSMQYHVDQVDIAYDLLNATHLIGYAAASGEHWSVAGVGVRMVAATLSSMDTPGMSDMIIAPEIQRLARLSGREHPLLLAVLGSAFARVIGDATEFAPHESSPAGGMAGEAGRVQDRAAQLAMMVGQAYRLYHVTNHIDGLRQLYDRIGDGEVALASFGLANMLAVRARELWGRPRAEGLTE